MFIPCLLVILGASSAFGMDCNFIGSRRFEDQLLHTCPRPFQERSKSYCCPTQGGSFECCDLAQFISTPPFDTAVLLGIIAIFIVFGCCVFGCCMCCWCALRRNRSRGRVLYASNGQGF